MKTVVLDADTLYSADSPRWNAFGGVGEIVVYERTDSSEIAERIADADAVLTNKVNVDAAAIAAAPLLKYIGVLATGYNVVDLEAAGARSIVVTNVPAYSTASVAQHAIALLLELTDRVGDYAARVATGRWNRSRDFTFRITEGRELAGQSFGVIGFGNTGRATAAIAAALGMNILVYTSRQQSELPEGYRKVTLDEVFTLSDVLSLHCPLTKSTFHLVDARCLAMMKPDALLINTSRGPVVDEEALAKALDESQIAGAGLDVLSQEPPRASNPLLTAHNCIITPHTAWSTAQARERLFNIALGNLKAFADGVPVNTVC